MAHIIINPSLSAAIGYSFFICQKFAVVIAILEQAISTRTDNSMYMYIGRYSTYMTIYML